MNSAGVEFGALEKPKISPMQDLHCYPGNRHDFGTVMNDLGFASTLIRVDANFFAENTG